MAPDRVAPTPGLGRTISVGGVDLYCDDQGDGAVVVLLHGGLMDHQSWGNQIPELSRGHRVISPDTRGHGRSGDSDVPFSYELFASDVAGLLGALDIPTATVVGFSDGGCTALNLAIRHPGLVERLILIGTPYDTANGGEGSGDAFATITPEELYAMIGRESVLGEMVRKAEAQYHDEAAWRAFFAKLVNGLWPREPRIALEDLARITAPTLVLHAENDEFYSPEVAQTIADTVADGRLRVIPAAPHTAPQEQPVAVNASILGFLDGRA